MPFGTKTRIIASYNQENFIAEKTREKDNKTYPVYIDENGKLARAYPGDSFINDYDVSFVATKESWKEI